MNQCERKKDSIWSFAFFALMATSFFQSMASLMTNTTLPVYVDQMGASASVVGVVVGAFAVTSLLCRPFAGPAFDSFSKKRLLLFAQGISCAAMILFGIADSIPFLLCARLLHGIGLGCAVPLAVAFVSEFIPATKMSSGISIYALAQTSAQVIGPAVGLYFMEAIGFSATYFLTSACFLAAMVAVGFVKEPVRERLAYKLTPSRMFAREAVTKSFVLSLLAVSFSCASSYVVLYGNLLGIQNVGAYFTVYAICLLATRPLFGKLADRWGGERVLLIGAMCFIASYVLLSTTQDFMRLMLVAVVGSAGYGSCSPLVQSLALASVPPERRGAASNTVFTGIDIGMLLGPILAGSMIELLEGQLGSLAQSYSVMWLIMTVPIIIATCFIVYWNVKKCVKK